MPLFGLVDLTIITAAMYLWLLAKYGPDRTRAYRALLLVLWTVASLYSFGMRL